MGKLLRERMIHPLSEMLRARNKLSGSCEILFLNENPNLDLHSSSFVFLGEATSPIKHTIDLYKVLPRGYAIR